MATREENIKKINEELEKLDDEQLEQVAGGRMMSMPEQNQETDLVARHLGDMIGTNNPVQIRMEKK